MFWYDFLLLGFFAGVAVCGLAFCLYPVVERFLKR